MRTRDPSGYGEDGSIIGLAAAFGAWIGGKTGDPELALLIATAIPVLAHWLAKFVRNYIGAPLASRLGAGPARGTILPLLLCCWLVAGCAFQVTGDGLQFSVGQAAATTCGDLRAGDDAEAATECSTAEGGALSTAAASIVGVVLGLVAKVGGAMGGVPVP